LYKILAQSIDGVRSSKDNPPQVLGEYYQGYLLSASSYGRPERSDELSLKRIHRADRLLLTM
jgi:hypothetical protein